MQVEQDESRKRPLPDYRHASKTERPLLPVPWARKIAKNITGDIFFFFFFSCWLLINKWWKQTVGVCMRLCGESFGVKRAPTPFLAFPERGRNCTPWLFTPIALMKRLGLSKLWWIIDSGVTAKCVMQHRLGISCRWIYAEVTLMCPRRPRPVYK